MTLPRATARGTRWMTNEVTYARSGGPCGVDTDRGAGHTGRADVHDGTVTQTSAAAFGRRIVEAPRNLRAMSSEDRLLEAAAPQALSNEDQRLSDRDQGRSNRDQGAADNDQIAADNDQIARTRGSVPGDDGRDDRDDHAAATSTRRESARTRAESRVSRATEATERDVIGGERDAIAVERDAAASQMDASANRLERAILSATCTPSDQVRAFDALVELQRAERTRAAQDRVRAAEDRARAALARQQAAAERDALLAELVAAHHDDLTGVYRRTMGRVALTHALARAKRDGRGVVLAFLDVDDMKGVNDRGGHGDGDAALRTVADIMQRNLRSYDPVVRWGGDEFVAALGGTTLADARSRLSDIQREMSIEGPTTVSFGLALWDGEETLDELIARADAALLDGRRSAVGSSV